jgi:TATA-box binding protein (TBP) (component of TFIID and TFIIIB)
MALVTATKTHISTMVYGAFYNSIIDCEAVFETLKIDRTVIGIKYMNNYKGKVKQTSSFFNSVTVIIYLKSFDKEVNMKVFTDGKVQLSGVKCDEHVISALEIFKNLIKTIVYTKNIEVIVHENIIYNEKDFNNYFGKKHTRFNFIKIYGKSLGNKFKVIGERKGNDFTIFVNGVRESVADFDNDYFIQTKKTPDHIKLLFDKNGNIVGRVKYIFRRIRKNITIKGTKFIEDDTCDVAAIICEEDKLICVKTISMYDKYNNFIGKQLVLLDKTIVPQLSRDTESILLPCIAIQTPEIEKDFNIKPFNINCDFQIITEPSNLRLRLKNLYEILKYKGVNTYYNPESDDPALNIKLYFSNIDNSFVQILNNKIYSSKKEHKPPEVFDLKASIRVFNTNKISIHGCTSKTQIVMVKKIILDLFIENVSDFYYDISDSNNKSIVDENINIFDLI